MLVLMSWRVGRSSPGMKRGGDTSIESHAPVKIGEDFGA
jgi:hypothetical protein